MNNFIITTDTTSDLPAAYVEQHQIGMLSLTYTINDTTYSWEHPLPVKEFYDCMRQGSLPTTSQANPEEAAAVFEKIINEQNSSYRLFFRFKRKLQQRKARCGRTFRKIPRPENHRHRFSLRFSRRGTSGAQSRHLKGAGTYTGRDRRLA